MLDELYTEAVNKLLGEHRKNILNELNNENESIKMSELSRRFKMSAPLLTFHVTRLIKYGLVAREHNNQGIITGVKLTNKGKELIKKLFDKNGI